RVSLSSSGSIGDRENIALIILPSLIVSSVVNIFIGICIGLYASRKYAVPIFKLEKWAVLLRDGRFNTHLNFREETEMRELCARCNDLSAALCDIFKQIHTQTIALVEVNEELKNQKIAKPINAIRDLLNTLEFDEKVVEVHTSILKTGTIPLTKPQ
ncbi:MAG: hypothetical protein JW795_16840, partial [Chitinivibrionales bacterium]|nr:hypothetical protein [Chitinivibrionales bacterium]